MLSQLISKVIIRSSFNLSVRRLSHEYVPKHKKTTNYEIQVLQQFIDSVNKVLVLTGAGISTESGIPDYRSEGVGLYDRKGHKPIEYQDFLKSDAIRRRYWARNYCGTYFCHSPSLFNARPFIKNVETLRFVRHFYSISI